MKKIIENLNREINEIESEIDDVLIKAEKGIKITKRYLERLRGTTVAKNFKSKATEIEFFKSTKPQLYCKLIYYVNLFNIESKRPRSSNKSQVKYFNKNIDKLQTYFNDNLEFYLHELIYLTFL